MTRLRARKERARVAVAYNRRLLRSRLLRLQRILYKIQYPRCFPSSSFNAYASTDGPRSFSMVKNAHQKRLREALRKGNLTFNCRDFAGSFTEIFEEGFTAAHIIAGFEKSGIFPPTEAPAVSYLLKKKLKTRKAIDPALSSLLPAENRFPMTSDTARDVSNRYHDILSSPAQRGLKAVQKIVNEAIVLEDVVKKHVTNRQERIEKRYH
ncbi:uncharacterized protein FMAN_07347 [Fusarium mangiferae]|uniref:Uncharacterized protein n=1 Tax=Fusarium mangiferae TaxID=192010 RepID=A0A1L7TAX1_FUSMA|nr:uncharacterized protein FMAN_07347 [Fusarium mangiferae]CVK92451.1 uncharacterized protein FMAN_07347 [Fusarium mangiferae]